MVNGKRPWRADLKEAYDRVTERDLLPIYELTKSEPAESGRAPAWGVGGRRFESDHQKRDLPEISGRSLFCALIAVG